MKFSIKQLSGFIGLLLVIYYPHFYPPTKMKSVDSSSMLEQLANQQENEGSNPSPRINFNKNYSKFKGKIIIVTYYDHFDINDWDKIESFKEVHPIELTGVGKCLFEDKLYLVISSCWDNLNEYDNVQFILQNAPINCKL